jgi:serine/threonine protein kinase
MIVPSCPACRKPFSVDERLAGKKGICPSCGRSLDIPAQTVAPAQGARAAAPVAGSASTHDPDLTAFLTPPQAEDELGRLGAYRILKVLGQGRMGVVFEAEDPNFNRAVALKTMLPALASSASAGMRFLREAQAMACVRHAHIVSVMQVGEERGVPFIVMELLKGEPLEERLRREDRVPPWEALRISRELAEALGAVHAAGMIHRDVEPRNVWLEAPLGRVKLLDFGLVRAASREAGLTQRGVILGTPGYMAPEQARGEEVDARGDLFGLGCVLYRMLTGRQPFQARDEEATLLEVISHHPLPPAQVRPGVPPMLAELVMKLMEKDLSRRPTSAADVVGALRALEQEIPGPTALEKRDTGPAWAEGSRTLLWAFAAVVLLGLLIGLVVWVVVRS